MTSNPAIFEKAIGGSDDYAACSRSSATDPRPRCEGLYEKLAIKDIQDAADVLRPVYDAPTRDGYVSLEVSPDLADDTARHRWTKRAACGRRSTGQRDDQGAGDTGGHPRHPAR